MAINSVSSYSPMFDYQGWVSNANSRTTALKSQLGYEDESTSSTSSSSSTSKTSSSYSSAAVSTSSFLLNYKQTLTDLESASSKLQVGSKNNVFSKYESAVAALSKADTEDARKAAQEKVDKAQEDIISAITDFADKYNSTVSFLKSNSNRSAGVVRQLESLQRSLPTDNALSKALGMSTDTSGNLQVNKDELKKRLESGYDLAKDVMGGQYGIAQRTGTKATSILDSSIDTVVGSSSTSASQSSSAGLDYSSLGTDSSMSAYFSSFANFARSGAYNLSNYYAVGMLMNTLA